MVQKHVNFVDLVKSFPTNILLQNLASIQKRTSSVKFAHLAEKSGKGSISNLSTKASAPRASSTGSARDASGAPKDGAPKESSGTGLKAIAALGGHRLVASSLHSSMFILNPSYNGSYSNS